jgi:predicted N-acetyltransferase YhbS
MDILIRLAHPSEIPALEQLITRSVRALSVGYYTPEQIESALRYVFGVDTQLIADGTYFVAEANGEIAGCGGWSKRKTLYGGDKMKAAEDTLLDPAREPARIRAFFVDPAWARRGIGRQIIAACEEAAGAAGFTQLELAATLPGEPLYAAVGYQAIERLEVPMPDGVLVPIVKMGKQLSG